MRRLKTSFSWEIMQRCRGYAAFASFCVGFHFRMTFHPNLHQLYTSFVRHLHLLRHGPSDTLKLWGGPLTVHLCQLLVPLRQWPTCRSMTTPRQRSCSCYVNLTMVEIQAKGVMQTLGVPSPGCVLSCKRTTSNLGKHPLCSARRPREHGASGPSAPSRSQRSLGLRPEIKPGGFLTDHFQVPVHLTGNCSLR